MNSSRCSRFPDNSVGAIDADDIRAAITELWGRASTATQVFGYAWVTSGNPPTGRATGPWVVGPGVLQVSETTDDGQTLSFAILDYLAGPQVSIVSGPSSVLRATVTGPSVDQGGYRDIPVDITSVTGSAPTSNAKVSLVVMAVLP